MDFPTHLIQKIDGHFPDSTGAHLKERLRGVSSMAEADAENGAASYRASEERHERTDDARRKREASRENRVRGIVSDAEDREVELAYKNQITRSRREDEKHDAILQQAEGSKTFFKNTVRFLNGLPWKAVRKPLVHFEHDNHRPDPSDLGPDIQLFVPTLPDGDRKAIVADQQALNVAFKLENGKVDHAGDRIETTKQRAHKMVAEMGARGAPTVTGAGEPWSRLSVVPPLLDIGAAPNGSGNGNIPKAPDALALLCWAMPERIIEAVEASIDEAYLAVELQLDPHERQRRKRELKLKILEAERIECEAIWQLVRAGDTNIRFRPDTDPRAILGIA